MPAFPRRHLLRRGLVSVYHCWTRCVRRAFLCGKDRYSGRDYEHRRDWIWDVEEQLAGLFAIEVEFRAEMQNHLHIVLRTRPDVVQRWPREKIVRNWLKITRLKRGSSIDDWQPSQERVQQILADPKLVKRLARRLSNLSWFMGALCENIARRANLEDGCRGHFFQSRYYCKLLDQLPAILACGIYTDLNQIRAGEASTPETSRHTSVYDRIQACLQRAQAERQITAQELLEQRDRWMSPLELLEGADADQAALFTSVTGCRASDKGVLPMALERYLELLDWTGRQLRGDKRGAIPTHLAGILDRLGIQPDEWLPAIEAMDEQFSHMNQQEEFVAAAGLC